MNMNKKLPSSIYEGYPCSVVAVGCALGLTDAEAIKKLLSPELHDDGYLSLSGMNHLARTKLPIVKRYNYKRGERLTLLKFSCNFKEKAIVCVSGHYIYYNGEDYYSFFNNEFDDVIAVWQIGKI